MMCMDSKQVYFSPDKSDILFYFYTFLFFYLIDQKIKKIERIAGQFFLKTNFECYYFSKTV